jgi:hypothetical protein
MSMRLVRSPHRSLEPLPTRWVNVERVRPSELNPRHLAVLPSPGPLPKLRSVLRNIRTFGSFLLVDIEPLTGILILEELQDSLDIARGDSLMVVGDMW